MEACLREFAAYGYDLASTNRITQACGISKGVLFKYFGDKEGLFLWLCEENIRLYTQDMQTGPYPDIFACVIDFTRQKLRWLRDRPLYYQLSMRIFKEPLHPVYAKTQAFTAAVRQKQLEVIQSLLPISGLKPSVTDEQALAMMFWVAQGLQDQYLDRYPDSLRADFDVFYENIAQQMEQYFDLIRFGIFCHESTTETKPDKE